MATGDEEWDQRRDRPLGEFRHHIPDASSPIHLRTMPFLRLSPQRIIRAMDRQFGAT
jgi:hypothetical protein